VKYAWIHAHRDSYPVKIMCKVLEVSTSGYYDSLKPTQSPRQQRREQIAAAAEAAYRDSHCIYGYRKVHDDLQEQKIECCRETARRVLHEKGLFSRTKRKFVVTTDSRHEQPVAANVLARDFQADAPNQKWTSDITYIATRQGWLYLAVVMDLFSRKIVGWATSSSLQATLVLDALGMALRRRTPGTGLVHHSDRGCQYAAADYQRLLADHGIVCSMSRKGNCWDNAPTESFFGKLKVEWVHGVEYANHDETNRHLFEYIEVFYNRKRKHAALGYESPAAFENMFYLQSLIEAA
jgi:transposase InsO family protein